MLSMSSTIEAQDTITDLKIILSLSKEENIEILYNPDIANWIKQNQRQRQELYHNLLKLYKKNKTLIVEYKIAQTQYNEPTNNYKKYRVITWKQELHEYMDELYMRIQQWKKNIDDIINCLDEIDNDMNIIDMLYNKKEFNWKEIKVKNYKVMQNIEIYINQCKKYYIFLTNKGSYEMQYA